MITTLLFDFSRVLLHPKDPSFMGKMNDLNNELSQRDPNYAFFDYFVLNTEILNWLKSVQHKFSINMFTTDVIQERPEVQAVIGPIFERTFKAKSLGLLKKDPAAYLHIARELHKQPQEIVFIDDTAGNIAGANEAGMQTILYTTNEALLTKLKSI